MNEHSLSPDDLPPSQVTYLDEMLIRNLEEVIGKHFYTNCGRIVQVLLSNCQWCIKTNSRALILIIICPDREMYWHILNAIPDVAKKLKQFSQGAIIRLCPPIDKGTSWEISVREISTYRGWLNG
ncbi:hypothetical protein [Trichormus variabilis]|uniref:Uncharacterized protein n=1 Tax=Trichormus variabilis SAG 1403-4b TaxID=447716 RepID=A0A433V1V5_ANAVA|nr:hypothetical protein [Trichormus variabilis]MBD2627134.1 hypothetical protein [Trichormus variabilis FACHB-164]RUT00073.1 hypothetical protein DSM107003_06560 [Trichormus variabilis SAG 1403-4b]